jgi:hypothetical protein
MRCSGVIRGAARSFHHDLVHQLTLPLDNQVTWLRSPQVNMDKI